VKLASTWWGNANTPALACLHGVRGHGPRFRSVGERLSDRMCVIAYDLRGHGRSGWGPPWDLSTHCADVLESVGSLELRPAGWLAHSFGARILLEITAAGYDIGETAILLEPAFGISPWYAARQADAECCTPLLASAEEGARTRIEQGAALPEAADLVAEHLAEQMDPVPGGSFRLRYSPAAVVCAWSEMSKNDPSLDCLPPRTLVVLGSKSIVPAELTSQLDRYATVRRVRGGHNVLWDAPHESIGLIEEWMAA
jgi:pimeloyl-ACP methyl ester carboxylesterase